MFPGWMQIALVALLVLLLFGRGKISGLMGDVAKGITSFKKGLKEGLDEPEQEETKTVADRRTIDGEIVKTKEETKS
ncbi:twin-arginine translocase TatA/TatE family subunit [Kordiimonas pumila]|uniref:Sec-independent protein translocase protein TatA n=1 Tax=Kordiimonas pumila TaxID=2161677 RepID=A0ABV7D2Z0_9PROT|nr:twin-arginine translocase TatA/TatE family subunit [Kordiimonas pumila]